MKLSHAIAPSLLAIVSAACSTHSTHASAPDRAEQAEEDKRHAQDEAQQARLDAEKARLDAQDATRAQREADQKAQQAAQRAALVEHDAQQTQPTDRAAVGTTERQRAEAADARADARVASNPVGVGHGNAVVFAADGADLTADDKARLEDTVRTLRAHPSQTVVVQRYADDAQLSRKRADAVAQYLESKGIARDRIVMKDVTATRSSTSDAAHGRGHAGHVEVVIQ